MKKPEIPENEKDRITTLHSYNILDTPVEEAFDSLTQLAAHITDTPVALISFVDTDRQWFKSRYGVDAPGPSRELSFCGHVVADDQPLVVNDALQDSRFSDNPSVVSGPRFRFYAGYPLATADGYVMGTLCVLDHEARSLSEQQLSMLELLSKQVVDQLEFRRANVELRTYNEFFDLSLNLLCTANENLHFEALNPAWTELLGWSLEELRSKPFTEFVHPDDLESTISEASRLLAGRHTVNFENRYRHKDGHWVPLSWVSAVHGSTFYATATDMTQYNDVIAELSNLASVVQTSHDAIITIDTKQRVVTWNRAAELMTGFTKEEMIGEPIHKIHPPGHTTDASDMMAQLLSGEPVPPLETKRYRKDGSQVEVSLTISPLFDANGDLKGLSSIVRDITQQKKLDRLKSEFVSTVSHELRTPLTSIRGALGLVAGGVLGELPEEAKEYVNIAVANSERLVRLINDILDIEKMESGRMEFRFRATELAPLIHDSITAIEPFAHEQGVAFKVVTEIPDGEVLIDPDRFTQVLTNLLSNAAKFSPTGTTIDIAIDSDASDVMVSIRDYGPGVPEEFEHRIFQRFSQADSSTTRRKGGTGLGLAISKAIVEKMNGTIGFRNVVGDGDGAVFFFKLPFLPPVVDVRDTNRITSVLVCEDDPDAARVLERMLHEKGYRVDITPTIERARRLIAKNRYAAITLDVVLADGLGTELLRELRANPQTQKIPVIIVSGSIEHMESGVAFLVSDVLEKPFEESRLLAAVNNAIEHVNGSQPRLLHVEDEEDLRRVVFRMFEDQWTIVSVNTVAEGKRALADEEPFDLVLLDLDLPDGNGDQLIEHVGEAHVIIFSATDVPAELDRRVVASLVKSRNDLHDIRTAISELIEHAT